MTNRRRALPVVSQHNARWHRAALLRFFAIVVAHWVEHVVQSIQIWIFDRPSTDGHRHVYSHVSVAARSNGDPRAKVPFAPHRPSGCGDTVHSREAVVATATRRSSDTVPSTMHNRSIGDHDVGSCDYVRDRAATIRACSTTLWGILTLGGGVWIYPDFVAEAQL